MKPFFQTSEPAFAKTPKIATKKRAALFTGGCDACGLHQNCLSPKMPAWGLGLKGILLIAESPGLAEDKRGEPLVGQSGKRLTRELARLGIDIYADCRKINAVACYPGAKKDATDREVALCRHRVMAEIKENPPTVIIALGGLAMRSLCQHRALWDTGFPSMTNWQGEMIPDQDLGCWIVPTWHPAFVERMENALFDRRWREDLKKAVDLANGPPPIKHDFEAMIDVVISPTMAAAKLQKLYECLCAESSPLISFDYETTGLKPYIDGHACVCCSIAITDRQCISYLLTKETWPITYRILRHPKIGKAAHNMKFEQLWSKVRGHPEQGGFDIRNWKWDSMLAAHILDNRTGRAGLKFQAYIKLGVLGYDDEIAEYIKGDKKNSNSFNRVREAPVRSLLLYCGHDSLFEHRLCTIQQRLIYADEGLTRAYELFHNGALALVDAEVNGIVIDLEYCEKQRIYLEKRVNHLKQRILSYPEVQKWKSITGSAFNLNSAPQLSKLLYNELGLSVSKTTDSGAACVDKTVLEDIDLPFVHDLLQIKKYEKIISTYLRGYLTEAPDGFLHPFYHLHKVISYRGSCSNPNFQNVPKRDSEAQKIVRRALKPRSGMCWFEVDYSGIEVRIAATNHKDPEMIRYLNDPTTDMHRDTCMDLLFMTGDQVTKYLRNAAKNGFVFAQFYGDWYKACAENMWNKWFNTPDAVLSDGNTHVKTHLAKQGIKNLKQFTAHVKEVEDIFWLQRFPVYNQWRDDHVAAYNKRGWFRGHTGFKYTSIMSRNDAVNYGTQGPAFHCLLWAMTQINNRLKKEKWISFLIGQIHDAIDGNAATNEINDLLPMVKKTMIDDLTQHFEWINVPIDVEFEMAPVGKSWFEVAAINPRPIACACGLEWGYGQRQPDASVRWTCPVCDHLEIVRKKS